MPNVKGKIAKRYASCEYALTEGKIGHCWLTPSAYSQVFPSCAGTILHLGLAVLWFTVGRSSGRLTGFVHSQQDDHR